MILYYFTNKIKTSKYINYQMIYYVNMVRLNINYFKLYNSLINCAYYWMVRTVGKN